MTTSNSFDSGSTIPTTPENFVNETNEHSHSAFALLRPLTEAARKAFDATVNAVIKHNGYDHYRQFLRLDESRTRRSVSPYTEDGSDEATEPARWTGDFQLSLDVDSNDLQNWWVGSHTLPGEIDVLLSPGDPDKELRIAHKHARLFIHPESYRLVIEARHSITIGRVCTPLMTLTNWRQQTLEDGDTLIIGSSCTYVFRYTDFFRSPSYANSFLQYRNKLLGAGTLNPHLTPNSVGIPIPLGKFFCSPSVFAKGTFGTVSVGWSQEGAAVAIKRFKNPTKEAVLSHERIMDHIKGHDNILQLLDSVHHLNGPAPDAYCVYSPLATVVLREIIATHQTGITTKLALLSDYLSGLSYLHDQKTVMHLDISPGNLAITSLNSPKGIIIDLDAAVQSVSCFDHRKGTLPYLAPEIIDLKSSTTNKPFERSVDVWALGLCMFDLCQRQCMSWTRLNPPETPHQRSLQPDNTVSRDRYQKFLAKMDSMKTSAETTLDTRFFTFIERMTKYSAASRPTASKLYAEVFEFSESLGRGTIVPHRVAKRSREE